MEGKPRTIHVEGRAIRLTNPDKILYPSTGTRKGDVLEYYLAVAERLVGWARDRPATRKRWVHGVGTAEAPGQAFFTKQLERGAPAWVARQDIPHTERVITYPLVNDAATLAWLTQVDTLEIHVPQWRFTASGEQGPPDRLVLDLDPGPGTGLRECVRVAREARDILAGMGLGATPVTSGSKGIHLYAQLTGTESSEQVSAVARALAEALRHELPTLVVSEMRKSLRVDRVLLDWSQNNARKTTICPWSLRGRLTPTVAAPRDWDELDDPQLAQLSLHDVLDRLDQSIGNGSGPVEGTGGRDLPPPADRADHATLRSPERSYSPMLATPGTLASMSGAGWAYEMKWDGIRVIARVRDHTVRLTSRGGRDVTATYPELAQIAARAGVDMVLDGEVVAIGSGRPDFALLQRRMNLTGAADIRRLSVEVPVTFMAFDLLEAEGQDLTGQTYDERRALLEDLVPSGGVVQVPLAHHGSAAEAMEISAELGLEGVVAKRRTSRYHPGVRSSSWLKVKHHRSQEVVVVGWRPLTGGVDVGSVLMAVPDPSGALVFAGRVGSGFSDRARAEARELLLPLAVPTPQLDVPSAEVAGTHWVDPRLVAEVRYGEVTPEGRLRHPVWRGWRPDRMPQDVRWE